MDWIDRYKEFRQDILHHIEEEENALFDVSRSVLDQQTLNKLGNEMVRLMAKK